MHPYSPVLVGTLLDNKFFALHEANFPRYFDFREGLKANFPGVYLQHSLYTYNTFSLTEFVGV